MTLTVWQNDAESLNNQLSLMLRNGVAGFALVFLVLALFLELRLAFWVRLGIPISFFGAPALMPGVDVSINVLSLFGFVLVLGMWSTTRPSWARTSTATRRSTATGCAGPSRVRTRSASR